MPVYPGALRLARINNLVAVGQIQPEKPAHRIIVIHDQESFHVYANFLLLVFSFSPCSRLCFFGLHDSPVRSSARHALAAGTLAAALPMSHTPTSLLAARGQPSANRTSFLCKSLKQNGDASPFAFFLRTCRTLSHPPCVTPNLLSRFDTPFLWFSIPGTASL